VAYFGFLCKRKNAFFVGICEPTEKDRHFYQKQRLIPGKCPLLNAKTPPKAFPHRPPRRVRLDKSSLMLLNDVQLSCAGT
jgi:hypothetical protein